MREHHGNSTSTARFSAIHQEARDGHKGTRIHVVSRMAGYDNGEDSQQQKGQ